MQSPSVSNSEQFRVEWCPSQGPWSSQSSLPLLHLLRLLFRYTPAPYSLRPVSLGFGAMGGLGPLDMELGLGKLSRLGEEGNLAVGVEGLVVTFGLGASGGFGESKGQTEKRKKSTINFYSKSLYKAL